MSSNVNLDIWGPNSQNRSVKLENVDLGGTVEGLKTQACKQLESHRFNIDLVFCGLVMEDEDPISVYGVTSGDTVHVVKKNIQNNFPRGRALSEVEVQQLVGAYRTFTLSPGYRAALQRLSRPEVLETIIAATPGLAQDPAAIAFIQDPELMIHMADPDTVRRVADKHPSLIEGANYIAAHIHEEQANINTSQASTSTGYSYSLDALSDDEDMDSNPDSNREPQSLSHLAQLATDMANATDTSMTPLTRNASYNAITSAQLASAIANATNTAFNTNSAGMPPTSAPSSQPPQQPTQSPDSTAVITSEMFANAIQQAFAGTSFNVGGGWDIGNASTPNRENAGAETVEAISRRLQPQLLQMREMGMTNDVANVRALQATNGDVQAAIELVFSGALND